MIKSDLFVEDENNDLIPFPLIVVKSGKDSKDRKPQLNNLKVDPQMRYPYWTHWTHWTHWNYRNYWNY